MSSILIQDVSKTFETKDGSVHALKNVSLSIESGDIYGIIGMSGAGKSTLVRCMNFLEVPSEGKVLIDGKSLSEFSPKELRKEREKIGMIFQHFNLLMQKNVLENVCFPLYIQGKKKAEARAKALELLEIVGLADRAKAYPAQLSGGQKQRVAIARALASDPQILLCDEATSALDPQTTSSILELLQDINQKFGITIVIITHQMSVVREICTHVAIMKDGEVKEQGLVEEIFSHPKSQVAKELISKDSGNDVESKKLTQSEIQDGEIVRIVFSENSAFEPVIANLILTFHEPVNILKANTKNVGGVAKGEMILQFMSDSTNVPEMKKFLTERGLEIGEAN
ncbi:methionine ABC transporter ATP-binding protein [Blautia segnis]|uniref:Methionine ABC transporter ATP-binding protein n=1 Tax=Blautia segnis TaxID=2763030 RepID=A0A8I0DPV3_9FIRM|nr:methionine ABC transporter ATP-binding protein [Blautia segnis]MBC5650090.1 methionine ABC transporter ATP-binding protein [Blautia segnis]